ncbi:glycosyltransferase family 2 protein [Polynucleobacter sp. es-EL-1]|uniref:glycosyltransferase family 2 protein n=1 Tax=Polynucleobacter sp. es-EL-1 TaxID=1855652 RepID=UPI00203C719E|nr:glycosyltransferase family 2 protein [Polynucleobacter sp. es-EL-1]
MIRLSVVIATFNSGKYLDKVLTAIADQNFPCSEIEVILVDGGSSDHTREIGEKYSCRWIENPRTEPIYAKYLGFLNAQGQYLVYLDHDEVLMNPCSFSKRVKAMEDSQDIKAIVVSGYVNPKGHPVINDYINEFGDPFSFFIYRLSKDARFFIPTLRERYAVIKESQDIIIFNLAGVSDLPLIELCAGGGMIDRAYFEDQFKNELSGPELIPHFFYLLAKQKASLTLSKGDELEHYSVDRLANYLRKIKWRIKNNIFFKDRMGVSGFSGRVQYSSQWNQIKPILFIPYALLVLPALLDSIYLCVTRKKIGYLAHVFLCMYCASAIVIFSILKLFGYSPSLKSYDEKKSIPLN